MRRIFATLLLLCFGFAFAAPVLAQLSVSDDADARLPICCRRGGEHHCSASSTLRPALRMQCPESRDTRATATHPVVYAVPPAASQAHNERSDARVLATDDILCHFYRNTLARGPPAPLSA